MAYVKTDWKNRVVEKPRTFTIQENADGTVTLIPAEGVIHEEGTPVAAAQMNKIEQGIVDAYIEIDKRVNAITVYNSANQIDPNTTDEPLILTSHANAPQGGGWFYIQTLFYSVKNATGNRAQIATSYVGATPEMYIRHRYQDGWTTWKRVWSDGNLTKANIGLGSVENYGIATTAQAQAGSINTAYMTPLRVAQAIASLAGNAKIASGYFTGDGVTGRTITTGFMPKFIMISKPYYHFIWGNSVETKCLGSGALNVLSNEITATSTGFRLWNTFSSSSSLYTNENGKATDWVAIG